MKIYKTINVERDILDIFICDRCKKEIPIEDDEFELQETYSISFRGGYGSIFGDLNFVTADLCQHCLKDLIGDFCIVK